MSEANFNRALDIIDSLLDSIGWLGGDAYEMDAVSPSISDASKFLEAHRPPPEIVSKPAYPCSFGTNDNLYTVLGRGEVYAPNKKVARRRLGYPNDKIICLTKNK